jgi:hypothetical protein
MNKVFPYLVIGFVWLLILILIDHTGEFPLIDDWAYAHGVKGYLDAGVLKISDWVAMTQVAHLFMGVGWVKVFGYSLEQLREMTLLVSFLGSFLFYWLTGYFSKSVVLRLVGTLIGVVNPIWMYLSHTFMTDVPFTIVFVALVGLIIYVVEREKQRAESSEQGAVEKQRAESSEQGAEIKWGTESREQKGRLLFSGFRLLKSARRFHLFPTTYYLLPLILVLSSILVLVRQTGLGLGFSFLLWVLLMDRDRRGRWLGFGLVLVGVQVSTLIGYEWFMASIDALSTRYHGASNLSWILARPWWLVRAAYYVLIQLQYLGMFLLPLLPFVWLKWRSVGAGSYSRWAYVAAGVVVLGIGVAAGGDILMNARYTHLMQYDTVGHVMTIDFTYERLEFSRDLYPLWVVWSDTPCFAAAAITFWSKSATYSFPPLVIIRLPASYFFPSTSNANSGYFTRIPVRRSSAKNAASRVPCQVARYATGVLPNGKDVAVGLEYAPAASSLPSSAYASIPYAYGKAQLVMS